MVMHQRAERSYLHGGSAQKVVYLPIDVDSALKIGDTSNLSLNQVVAVDGGGDGSSGIVCNIEHGCIVWGERQQWRCAWACVTRSRARRRVDALIKKQCRDTMSRWVGSQEKGGSGWDRKHDSRTSYTNRGEKIGLIKREE